MVRDNGDTLLHVCAEFNRCEIMKYMTDRWEKWNINVTNLAGETPLMYAAREGHAATIKYMASQYTAD